MTNNDQNRAHEARNSFTGKTLSDSQFDESWALAEIMERGIRKSGSFKEKLSDYSYAFSRSEKFDVMKGETIIRDQFKARYGQTMNAMRKELAGREVDAREDGREEALAHARQIEKLIFDPASGDTMPFYKAFDHVGGALAEKFNITESGAKTLMKDVYREIEGRDLYETGKALEEKYHHPKRDADRPKSQPELSFETTQVRSR